MFLTLILGLIYVKPDPTSPHAETQRTRFNAGQAIVGRLDNLFDDHVLSAPNGRMPELTASWGAAVQGTAERLVEVLPADFSHHSVEIYNQLQMIRMTGNLALGAKRPCGELADWAADTRAAIRRLHVMIARAVFLTPGVACGTLPRPELVPVTPDDLFGAATPGT